MDIARELGDLLTLILSPPGFAPGSLASGSATEDRMIDRWLADVRRRLDDLRLRVPPGSRQEVAHGLLVDLARASGILLSVQQTPPPPSATVPG